MAIDGECFADQTKYGGSERQDRQSGLRNHCVVYISLYDKLKPYVLPGETLLRLRALFSQGERLVSIHSQLLVANQSMKGYARELVKDIQNQNEILLKNFAGEIKAIDKLLKECLQEDGELQSKARLIQSVPGIGQQTAAYLLIVRLLQWMCSV